LRLSIFDRYFLKGNAKIDFPEFAKLMTPVLNDKLVKDDLLKTFKYFDKDNSGFITVKELSLILQQFGSYYSDQQISKLIAKVDKDSDGRLNFEGLIFPLEKCFRRRKTHRSLTS
jgi:Ca2+-binding EF-hand superfamily protein